MFRLTLNTAPATEPVTTAEAKNHLRVDTSDEDTSIDALVTAARTHVEQITRRALITQTWDYYLDMFSTEKILLPRAPLQSVESVTYVDVDGNTQTLDSSVYTVDTDAEPGLIYPGYGEDWPSVRGQAKAVTVTYVAGYGDSAADVPQPIRHAIMLLVGHWYENREAVNVGNITTELPMAVDALLAPYRVIRF